MKLHELTKSPGFHNKQKRRGRGNATGTGNYSGRGLKGQNSRSWSGTRAFFEWGQTSIVQRLPKARGFTRYYKLVDNFQVVNLGKLNRDERISDTMDISKAVLKDLGYIKNAKGLVKILGDGDYTKHLKFVDIDAFSKSAQEKIDKPGTASKVASKVYSKIVKGLQSKGKSLKKVMKKIAPKVIEKKVEKNVGRLSLQDKEGGKVETLKVKKEVQAPVEKKIEKKVETVKKEVIAPVEKKAPAKTVEKKVVATKVVAKKPVAKTTTKPTLMAGKPAAKKPVAVTKPIVKKPIAKKAK